MNAQWIYSSESTQTSVSGGRIMEELSLPYLNVLKAEGNVLHTVPRGLF